MLSCYETAVSSVPFWQFWNPASGLFGGMIMGLVVGGTLWGLVYFLSK